MRILIPLLLVGPLCAQDALSVKDAVALALRENRGIQAAAAGLRASEMRVAQARSGKLPKVDYSETYARSNNPVFVFSSLLTQHQFGMENFAIGPLNRPDSMNNFQSAITVDQTIYDGGQVRKTVASAELGRRMTDEELRAARMDVVAGVTRAYYRAVLAAENLKAAQQAVRSAEADLARAEAFRGAGMSTDVDVLSIRVHLAAVTERRIDGAAELEVARAALNDALGLPLDAPHNLTTALAPAAVPDMELAALEKSASGDRPETRQSRLAADLARNQSALARISLLPQIGFRAGFEADRQRFINRGGANWMASVSLRWNLFNGFGDKARIAEAGNMIERAEASSQRSDSAVRLQARQAYAGLRAAIERIAVAKASVSQAEESLRITQNRYEAGMANVTDLLRNETAALETRTRYLAAVHDQRIAATMLEYAAGRLTADSEVLN